MRPLSAPARQRGFTLIEILVGCAISVVGILVIFQTMAVWNRHSQTSIAGSDADTAGTLAAFNLERDIRLAGVGISTASSTEMGCPVSASQGARAFTFRMTPVVITQGAASAPDTIDVLYGSSAFFAERERVISTAAGAKFLDRRNGFKQGDLAIVSGTDGGGLPACVLVEITNTGNADGATVNHDSAVSYVRFYGGAASAVYNPSPEYALNTTAALFNLGPSPRRNRWEINGRVLQRTDLIRTPQPFDVAEGVIDLKAEYGVDANADGRIDDTEWTVAAPADWTTALAIRFAILVRSGQYERHPDAGASATAVLAASAPVWADGSPAHTFAMTNVDGTADTFSTANADPNNWRSYRYRVYQRVVPLRNVIWN